MRLAAAMTIAARVALAPALLALALAPAPALAVPFAIQLGPERVVLETPPGFSDALPHASPRLYELAERLTSPSNRILAFGVSDGDMRAFSTGERLSLRRYMLIATPKGLERESKQEPAYKRGMRFSGPVQGGQYPRRGGMGAAAVGKNRKPRAPASMQPSPNPFYRLDGTTLKPIPPLLATAAGPAPPGGVSAA